MNVRAMVFVGLLASAVCAGAQQKAVLVELFTSEGCSDCPPADALLARVGGSTVPTGQMVVALSEHVTYWNQLGWQDPFSQQVFTERQESYAQSFRLEGPYTPQIVVNGAKQVLGSDPNALQRALAVQPPSKVELKIVSVAPEGKSLKVTYTMSGDAPKHGMEVWAAVTQDHAVTKVARGENGGRTLNHVAVVRSLTQVATAKSGEAMTVKVPLGDAPGEKRHVVLFAQMTGLGQVLGVVTAPVGSEE